MTRPSLIDAFRDSFQRDERHQRRIDLMAAYERSVRARCLAHAKAGRRFTGPACMPRFRFLSAPAFVL